MDCRFKLCNPYRLYIILNDSIYTASTCSKLNGCDMMFINVSEGEDTQPQPQPYSCSFDPYVLFLFRTGMSGKDWTGLHETM